jgi:hypothetical protein
MTGNSIKDIQRRSYRMPIKKEGMASPKETALGLKAIKVATLYRVNINRKMANKFATQSIVLGILNRRSIQCKPLKGSAK